MEWIGAGQRQIRGEGETKASWGETAVVGRLESRLRECADVFHHAHYDTWPIHYPDNAHNL